MKDHGIRKLIRYIRYWLRKPEPAGPLSQADIDALEANGRIW